jgi:O-antigen biosynthesis protein
LQIVVPVYIVFWLSGIYFSGGYRKPIDLVKIVRGIIWGSVSILLVYSLVDIRFRFSRALILLGSAWALGMLTSYRLFFHWIKFNGFRLNIQKTKRIAIIGHLDEALRVQKLLEQTHIRTETVGFVAPDKNDRGQNFIGQLEQLNEIIRINRIDEIIFCAGSISSADIIKTMLDLSQLNVDYKIAPPESISIIGSNSIHTAGDLYVLNVNSISNRLNKRNKRIFDILLAVVFLVLSPVIICFFKKKTNFIHHVFQVLFGKKSWIGYNSASDNVKLLPVIKPGILHPGDMFPDLKADSEKSNQLNVLYAKDYSIFTDAEILFKGWKNLDRETL